MLVERDEQIAKLTAWVTGTARTHTAAHAAGPGAGRRTAPDDPSKPGRIAVVSGPVAAGKTALLHRVLERTADSGIRLLSAVTSASERHIPFGVVEELLRDAADAAGPLPLHGAAGTGELVPPQTLMAFHARLAGLAARGPVLIAIDDVQYADPQSLHCLLYALGRARSTAGGLALVVTRGPDAGAPAPHALDELLRQVEGLHLRLGPLSARGVEELLAHRTGASVRPTGAAPGPSRTAGMAASLHTATGGNPLLVHSLLDDRVPRQRDGEAADGSFPAGEQFVQNALICVHRTGADGLRVAQGVALLGSAAPRPLLARLVRTDERTVEQVLDALGDTGILRGERFRHGAVRAAVLESLADDAVVELRRRAARLLYEAGAAPMAVAAHLLGHGPGLPDEEWVPGVLATAAHTALASQRVEFAVRCLRLAEECSRDERERLRLRASMAKFIWRVKPSTWAQELGPLNAASREGTLPVGDSLRLVGDLLWNGWIDDAARAVQRAVAGMPQPPEPAMAAQLGDVRLLLASTYPTLLDRLDGALGSCFSGPPAPANCPEDAAMVGIRVLHGVLSAGAGSAPGHRDRAAVDEEFAAIAERILAGTRLTDETHVTIRACLLALLYTERLGEATLWTDRLLEEASEHDAPGWTAVMQAMRAHMALRRGEPAQAMRLAEEAMAQLTPHGWGVGIGMPLAALIEARTAMGDHEAAAALVDHPVPEQMLLTRYGLHYLYARGGHRLATGRHHAALTDFMACGRLMREWNMDREGLAPWRVGVAEATLALGNRDQAERFAREQLAREAGPRVRGLALRVLAAARPLRDRPALLDRAVTLLQEEGDSHELARTLTDLGTAYERLGNAAQSRSCTRRAWRIAEVCGAREGTQRVQVEPSARSVAPPRTVPAPIPSPTPVRPTRPSAASALTDAERRVAALAAHGYTNREIGAKLFITVSTVEQHLTRVYRKINITRRQDLPVSWDTDVAHTA
ncbi:LuxR family transcriptional regulator [Streptomyces sp. RerS4]|uniref:helix-turn-helix transcriptional regulator n=1 Tax=Streptomyces sp. RerS4 TaxID=2942449 RepID=UPI00201C6312|nr:LuxR family transcriptional regulator [Streptomyces sp. RerS4]UQX03818.1 AAA family ATPase [Streptomyces sp. RerS4]